MQLTMEEINLNSRKTFSNEEILNEVVKILDDMMTDWDTDFSGKIGSDTKLVGDLEFESIDIVQFIVAIEEQFKQRGMPWEKILMVDGRYVDEINVGDTISLLLSHLNN